jgi:DegV family protein with EDD domain
MTRIAVVTDTTTYLPEAMAKEYGIHQVPLNVHFADAVFKDGELSQEAFFKKLAEAPELPHTSQPSAGEFAEAYRTAAKNADAVFAVVISSVLSGTYSSAMAARDLVPEIPVAVVDSRSTSMGLGYQAVAAARAARAGKSMEEIVAEVESMVPRTNVFFLLDTLKYLAKGGRIGGAQALMGSVLSIKALLQLDNGRIEPLDKVRTRAKAIERLLVHFQKAVDGKTVHCSVINTLVPDEAEALRKQVLAIYPGVKDLVVTSVSPTIATHLGPGCLGLCFYTE